MSLNFECNSIRSVVRSSGPGSVRVEFVLCVSGSLPQSTNTECETNLELWIGRRHECECEWFLVFQCGLQYIGDLSRVQPALAWRQLGLAPATHCNPDCRRSSFRKWMNEWSDCFRDIVGKIMHVLTQWLSPAVSFALTVWSHDYQVGPSGGISC